MQKKGIVYGYRRMYIKGGKYRVIRSWQRVLLVPPWADTPIGKRAATAYVRALDIITHLPLKPFIKSFAQLQSHLHIYTFRSKNLAI